MRLAVYVVAGWFLVSVLSSSLFAAGELGMAGLVAPAIVLGAIVWLVRGYRSTPTAGRLRDGFTGRLVALEGELDALEGALPADPLENEQIVAAWDLHDEHENATLSQTYDAVREQLASARRYAYAARMSGESEALSRGENAAEEVREYVRAFGVLAAEAPELLDRAIAAHADAQRAIEERRSDAEDATALELLVAADAKLTQARAALARGAERPLDALVLAAAAHRLADDAR